MRIAIIGDRGIPARYSGFSNLAEEVSTRLVREHGVEATVYCRRHYFKDRPRWFQGVRLVYLPAPGGKSFESILHSTLAILHASLGRYDAVLVVDPGNAPFTLPLKIRRLPFLIHTDGLGAQRRKWSRLQRRYYKWSEWVSARVATRLVTDSQAMAEYYRREYGADSTFIPYGSRVGPEPDPAVLERFGLEAGRYFVCAARIEAENNTDLIIREYKRAGVDLPLVVVGGARYESAYSRAVFAEHDGERVRCVGAVYDPAKFNGLLANCYAYLHGHEVGGTNPSLLRAMDAGAACVAIDVPFHREVLGDDGEYFQREADSLASILQELCASPDRVRELRMTCRGRADRLYRWDAVAAAYAEVFSALVRAKRERRAVLDVLRTDAYRPEERYEVVEMDVAVS